MCGLHAKLIKQTTDFIHFKYYNVDLLTSNIKEFLFPFRIESPSKWEQLTRFSIQKNGSRTPNNHTNALKPATCHRTRFNEQILKR